MLRMALLGLLILLSAGVLSAMELGTPPRRAVAMVQPPAEQSASSPAAQEPLAKADRLDIAAVRSTMPTQTAAAEIAGAPQEAHAGSPAPAPRGRPLSKPKPIASTARRKPKSAEIVVKRTAHVQRAKTASGTEHCRLKAFGGLLKALNMTGCEI
ncbi:MAG TPA: hypothetical protein VNK51_24175 [Bradyrhizobium sp.]|nr:hypothetical protein [Bradyrhizobium sp.]